MVTGTSTASVGGLISGLDTNSIISQLMQVEAQTQTNLKAKVATDQSNVSSLQDLNSMFASLTTSAADLANAASWNPVSVTSSSTMVSATASAGALTGPLSITVGSTAVAHQLLFANTAALTDTVTTGSTKVLLTKSDGSTLQLDSGNGTLGGLVAAINATGTGLKASTTRLDNGTYRLQVSSATTGAASSFTLTNLDGSSLLGGATVTTGQDASITIGTDTVHSATNTFSNITNGLNITLDPNATAGTVANLSVTQDTTSMTDKVKGFVDSINAALSKIDTLTAYNATTKTSGPLATDSGIRSIANNLLESVYPTDGTSLAGIGIQLDRYGKFTFDATAFSAAYAADPGAVAAKFTATGSSGFANRVQTVAKAASDPVNGSITTSITSTNTDIQELQSSIADWDVRLALRQQTLTAQFTAMESALSQLNSQSSWLSSQLGSSSSSSSGKGS